MKGAMLAAALACMVCATTPASADVKAGVDAWQQGDYAAAVSVWRPLAEAGDADAEFNLGQAYKLGRGVPSDLAVALEWFRKASAQGHQRASDNYGLLLFQQGQRDKAMPFIRASAERGEPRAQYILATAMFNGDLAPKDWVKAYAFMSRAAAAGLTPAENSLAIMDQYIPADQRQAGLALATRMKATPAIALSDTVAVPSSTGKPPVRTAGTNARRELPKPITSTAVPPSAAPPAPKVPIPVPTKTSDVPVDTSAAGKYPTPEVSYKTLPSGTAVKAPPGGTSNPIATSKPKIAPKAEPKIESKPASKAPSSSSTVVQAGNGSWRVQLGAFKEAHRAQALWTKLNAQISGVSGWKPEIASVNGLSRLRAGPFRSREDAEKACGQVKATGNICVVAGP